MKTFVLALVIIHAIEATVKTIWLACASGEPPPRSPLGIACDVLACAAIVAWGAVVLAGAAT